MTRQRRRPPALLLTLLLALLLSAAACRAAMSQTSVDNGAEATSTATDSRAPDGAAYRVEQLRLEGGTDWGAPSPYRHAARGPGQARMALAFASLLEKDEEGDVPWLAEHWEVEGSEYRFTLFEGCRFHDGQPLTTADVAFSIDYYRAHPPVSAPLGAGEGFLVSSYTIEDARSIVLHVAAPNADTLASLGAFPILPKHIWETVDEPRSYDGEGLYVGSGAYTVEAYEPASGSYAFAAFEGWVNGRPAARRVLFVPVSDPLLAFEAGEIDIATMPADLRARYLDDPAIGVVDKANDFGYKLLVNFERCPAFLDHGLRVGLYQAIDREAILERVFRGAGSVGSAGYVPEGSRFFNPDCLTYVHAPDEARARFAPLGLRVGLLTSEGADDINIAELIKLDLEAAGIAVQVSAYDAATRDQMINEAQYDFALVGNGGWGNNPPNYMRTIFSDTARNKGGNPHTMGPWGYRNEALTALAEATREAVDFDARIARFHRLQRLVSEEVPLIVLANRSSYAMYRRAHYDGWMKTYAYQQAEQNRLSYMDRR